jgi:hypothetical protein
LYIIPAVIMAASIEADTSTVESDESDDNDSYNLPNFMPPARVIMNRNRNHRHSSEATEMRIFRELFGTRLLVVENLWFLLDEHSLHPEGGLPKHLLWALHFMKAYYCSLDRRLTLHLVPPSLCVGC